jgi:glycerol-3-phosphate dehydrogenase (NAD(P)+)
MMRLAVIGAGSWGTALAVLMARNGHLVTLWGRDKAQVLGMQAQRRNLKYLPEAELPQNLTITADLAEAVAEARHLILVTPSHAFAEVLHFLNQAKVSLSGLAWATKGFDPSSGLFLHEVAEAALGAEIPLAVITGPSFAKEVALGLPTAVTVHSKNNAFAGHIATLLHSSHFRAYTGSDMIGAELGGAMKNVLAVATGVADGMQLGLNARAGLITRGLNEMLRLAHALGGSPVTMMGLAGVGDLVLTCTGDLSRNRRLGLALGQGVPLKEAIAQIGQVVESVQTVDQVMRLARLHNVELPISEQVQRVLSEQITPKEALRILLAREQKPEYPDSLWG